MILSIPKSQAWFDIPEGGTNLVTLRGQCQYGQAVVVDGFESTGYLRTDRSEDGPVEEKTTVSYRRHDIVYCTIAMAALGRPEVVPGSSAAA